MLYEDAPIPARRMTTAGLMDGAFITDEHDRDVFDRGLMPSAMGVCVLNEVITKLIGWMLTRALFVGGWWTFTKEQRGESRLLKSLEEY
jgi:hypothetical protein